jgi:hypothetical protein
MDTVTTWEIQRDLGPGPILDSAPGQDDFQSRKEAETYARKIGFTIVREVIATLNEDGDPTGDYETTDYTIPGKPNKVRAGAHAFCSQCKVRKYFKTGVEAYDWQFLHELQHGTSSVETWETEIDRPGERFPLRQTVSIGKVSVTVLLDGTQIETSEALLNELCAVRAADRE